MTKAMGEFLAALRASVSSGWEGTDDDRRLLVNAAAEFLEEQDAELVEHRKWQERWLAKLQMGVGQGNSSAVVN